MKKVLSVLLAAAMVMGMSVTSMAADQIWGAGTTGTVYSNVDDVVKFWDRAFVVHTDGTSETINAGKVMPLEAGDDVYFPLLWENSAADLISANTKDATAKTFEAVNKATAGYHYAGPIDSTWSINILCDEYYVDAASVYSVKSTENKTPWGTDVVAFNNYTNHEAMVGTKYIKVEISDEFVSTAKTIEFDFTLYLADGVHKTDKVIVDATYNGTVNGGEVSYTHTNNAAAIAKWTAPAKKGTAVFDFSDDCYFTVDMIPEEKVILNLSTAYNKYVDKLFDYNADLDFYNFKGSKDAFTKEGELFIPADDDTFIYQILSDADDKEPEVVAIEATYDDEYTIAGVNKEFEGWVIETDELGYYVVSDVELVIEAEEVVETPVVEDNKANPETGANDFVGAAVALAVVSVAAAGALALKK